MQGVGSIRGLPRLSRPSAASNCMVLCSSCVCLALVHPALESSCAAAAFVSPFCGQHLHGLVQQPCTQPALPVSHAAAVHSASTCIALCCSRSLTPAFPAPKTHQSPRISFDRCVGLQVFSQASEGCLGGAGGTPVTGKCCV